MNAGPPLEERAGAPPSPRLASQPPLRAILDSSAGLGC